MISDPRRLSVPLTCLFVFACATGLHAQDVSVTSSVQSYSFDDPRGVGLRGYSVSHASVTGVHSAFGSLDLGGTAHFIRATISPIGQGTAGIQGLADVELFARKRFSRMSLTAGFAPRTSDRRTTAESLIVGGLTATESLPFPVRGWGQTNRVRVDASLFFPNGTYTLELLGGVIRHGGFDPFESQSLTYQPGLERRLGLRLHHAASDISWVEVAGIVSSPSGDRSGDEVVYHPGMRGRVYLAGVIPARSASVLIRLGVYHRRMEEAPGVIVSQFRAPLVDVIGLTATPPRTVLDAAVESRGTVLGTDVRLLAEGRYGTDDARTWLVSVGVGADMEARLPTGGRWFFSPSATLSRGGFGLGSRDLTPMTGWEVGASLRWEGS